MCGLMGFVSLCRRRRRTRRRDGSGRAAPGTAGPRGGTRHDADVVLGFNRLSIIDIEHCTSRCLGAAGGAGRYSGVQQRDLQLPGAAGGLPRVRRRASHRRRRRDDHGRLPLLGRGRGRPAARHVRVPDLGLPAGCCSAPGPVRHQAAVQRAVADGVAFSLGEEGAARAAPDAAAGRASPAAAALPDAAVRARAGDHARRHPPDRVRHPLTFRPASRRTEWYFHPTFPARPVAGRPTTALYDADRRCRSRLGAQAHAGRRDGRLVPVRRHRLRRRSRHGQAVQPGPVTSPPASSERATRRSTWPPSPPRPSAYGTWCVRHLPEGLRAHRSPATSR